MQGREAGQDAWPAPATPVPSASRTTYRARIEEKLNPKSSIDLLRQALQWVIEAR
jgi:hypothetical protein